MYLVGSYAVKHITFHLHSTYRQQALEHRKIKHFREYTFSHHALVTFSFQKVQNVMRLDRYKKGLSKLLFESRKIRFHKPLMLVTQPQEQANALLN